MKDKRRITSRVRKHFRHVYTKLGSQRYCLFVFCLSLILKVTPCLANL